MHKYLYLAKQFMADTWVKGGIIPINPASTYRSIERHHTQTPDENLIHDSPFDLRKLQERGVDLLGARNFRFHDNFVDGVLIPPIYDGNFYEEDALILSFSNRQRNEIASRLGKEACVKIINIEQVKKIIDDQIKVIGERRDCEYREDHKRNHFTKSIADRWQREHRILWRVTDPKRIEVQIPEGLAIQVQLK